METAAADAELDESPPPRAERLRCGPWPREGERLLRNVQPAVGVAVGAGAQDAEQVESAPVQAIFDGSDGNTASISAGYVQGVTINYSKEIIAEYLDRTGRKIQPAGTITEETRVWYNPELKTRVFMVPAIVGLLLMIITLILTEEILWQIL